MMKRTRNGVVYRLEDIDKASRAGVNKSFGHKNNHMIYLNIKVDQTVVISGKKDFIN